MARPSFRMSEDTNALASTWSAVAVMIVKKHAAIAAAAIANTIL